MLFKTCNQLFSIAILLFWSCLHKNGQGLPTVEASFVTQSRQSTSTNAGSRLIKNDVNNYATSRYDDAAKRRRASVLLLQMNLRREDEIRQKIGQLKRQGKISSNKPSVAQGDGTRKAPPVAEQYGDKVKQKLGARKARLLGATLGQDVSDDDEVDPIVAELDSDEDEEAAGTGRTAQLGTLRTETEDEDENKSKYQKPSTAKTEYKNFDASLFEDDDEDEEDELSEQELIELVAEKLAEKRQKEKQEEEAKTKQRLEDLKKEQQELKQEEQSMIEEASSTGKSTSGIGGRWIKNNEKADADYKPSSSGTWGVFDRPKDISRAFGGGKRVGAGYTPDNLNQKTAEERTKDRLRQYREKVGIDVQSEKDHASEIEQALEIGNRAMQVRIEC